MMSEVEADYVMKALLQEKKKKSYGTYDVESQADSTTDEAPFVVLESEPSFKFPNLLSFALYVVSAIVSGSFMPELLQMLNLVTLLEPIPGSYIDVNPIAIPVVFFTVSMLIMMVVVVSCLKIGGYNAPHNMYCAGLFLSLLLGLIGLIDKGGCGTLLDIVPLEGRMPKSMPDNVVLALCITKFLSLVPKTLLYVSSLMILGKMADRTHMLISLLLVGGCHAAMIVGFQVANSALSKLVNLQPCIVLMIVFLGCAPAVLERPQGLMMFVRRYIMIRRNLDDEITEEALLNDSRSAHKCWQRFLASCMILCDLLLLASVIFCSVIQSSRYPADLGISYAIYIVMLSLFSIGWCLVKNHLDDFKDAEHSLAKLNFLAVTLIIVSTLIITIIDQDEMIKMFILCQSVYQVGLCFWLTRRLALLLSHAADPRTPVVAGANSMKLFAVATAAFEICCAQSILLTIFGHAWLVKNVELDVFTLYLVATLGFVLSCLAVDKYVQ